MQFNIMLVSFTRCSLWSTIHSTFNLAIGNPLQMLDVCIIVCLSTESATPFAFVALLFKYCKCSIGFLALGCSLFPLATDLSYETTVQGLIGRNRCRSSISGFLAYASSSSGVTMSSPCPAAGFACSGSLLSIGQYYYFRAHHSSHQYRRILFRSFSHSIHEISSP